MLQTPQFFTANFVIVGCVIIIFFILFFYLFIIQLHRRRAIHQKEMFDLQIQFEQTLLQSQLEIQEQTFRNISQEIHDNIGQVLSLAKLNLNTIATEALTDKIELTEELLGKAINDLRDLSKSLHSEKITDIGLIKAIQHELGVIEKVSSIKTEFVYTDTETSLNDEQIIITFRMIQEILNNIIRHAKATEVKVHISSDEKNTHITIKDNGVGFDSSSLTSLNTGIGLKSIKQRCKIINAICKIDSMPGHGTSAQIFLQHNK